MSLIGTRIDDLMDLTVDDLPDLMRGRPTEERVLQMKDGRGLFGHAISPQMPLRSRVQRPPRRGLARCARQLCRAGPGAGPDVGASGAAGPDPDPASDFGRNRTGKERLARAIHVSGETRRGFRAIRCAAVREFAALEEVAPATVFLRGVEDLSPEAQAALLDLLDRVSHLRFVSSCRCAPSELAAVLRGDLYHRLAGAVLTVPPLRYRADMDWLIDRLCGCAAGPICGSLRRRGPN